MRRLLPVVPLLAALALAFTLVPAGAAATTLRLEVTSYTTLARAHDTPPKGKPNKGDSIEFKDLLVSTKAMLGKAKGKPVGYDAGTIVYTGRKTQRVKGVATFPGVGTLTFEGAMQERKDGTVHVRVVKGSGKFNGATGVLVIGKGNEHAPNTYVVKLPHPLAPAAPPPPGANVA